MGKILVNVTEEDIKNGLRNNACSCPIALALQRSLNDGYALVATDYAFVDTTECYVEVDTTECYVNEGFEGKRFKLPEIARQFIENFDNSNPVQPFSFYLEGVD